MAPTVNWVHTGKNTGVFRIVRCHDIDGLLKIGLIVKVYKTVRPFVNVMSLSQYGRSAHFVIMEASLQVLLFVFKSTTGWRWNKKD